MTPRERAALAYGYAASAVNGALEMGQYDGLMMPWAKSEHDCDCEGCRYAAEVNAQ